MSSRYEKRHKAAIAGAKEFQKVMDSEAIKAAIDYCFPGTVVVTCSVEGNKPYPADSYYVTIMLDHEHYSIALTGEGTTMRGAAMNAIRVDGSPFCPPRRPGYDDIPF